MAKRLTPVFFILLLACLLGQTACNEPEAASRGLSSDQLYLDYVIWGEEGMENVTSRLQFKLRNSDGNGIRVAQPGKVELDGRVLSPDSTRFMGVFYEIHIPVDSFAGRHTIVFTGADGRKFTENFEFHPFGLQEEIPEQVRRAPFTIRLRDFPSRETPVRLVMIDTALMTEDVNEVIGVVNGELTIDEVMLSKITNGPINLEISREEERRLRQRPRSGGRIAVNFVLKRGFDLVD